LVPEQASRRPGSLRLIPDIDIWRAAMAMLKRYGDDAMLEACTRADHALEDGDWQGSLTWHRIIDALERLMAKGPAEGEMVH
jgi:hypothetical protein